MRRARLSDAFLPPAYKPKLPVSRLLRIVGEMITEGLLPPSTYLTEEEVKFILMAEQDGLRDPDVLMSRLEELWSEDYDETPVSPQQFLEDDFYLGRQASGLWPELREQFIDIFSGVDVEKTDEHGNPYVVREPYIEVVMRGSIGWGKTTLGSLCFSRMLYELSCLRHPQKFHGLEPDKPVVLMNLSVTGEQAEAAFYSYVKAYLYGDENDPDRGSPYFKEHFKRLNRGEGKLVFPKGIQVVPGNSKELSAIGLNIIGGAIDEFNFLVSTASGIHERMRQKQGLAPDRAMNLYRSIQRRIKSRLVGSPKFPGKLFLMSSETFPGDALDRHCVQVEGDPRVKILNYPAWGTRPKDQYCGETFRIFIGGATVPSKLLEPDEEVPAHLIMDDCRVMDVPIEYEEEFRQDMDEAIRDIAGVGTITISPFIPRRDLIQLQSETKEFEKVPLVHPWSQWRTTLRDGATFNPSVLAHQVKSDRRGADGNPIMKWKPRRSPLAPRFVHVDLGVTKDAAGFAMGYSPGSIPVYRKTADGEGHKEVLPIIVIEAMLFVIPPTGGEVQIGDVRGLLYDMRRLGFWFEKVTYDQYQSKESIQTLENQGFPAEHCSVVRDPGPYQQLKQAIYDARLFYYPHPDLLRELRKLTIDHVKNVVDHPVDDPEAHRGKGTKDLADCVAAVCQHAVDWGGFGVQPMAPSRGRLDKIDDPVDMDLWVLE